METDINWNSDSICKNTNQTLIVKFIEHSSQDNQKFNYDNQNFYWYEQNAFYTSY